MAHPEIFPNIHNIGRRRLLVVWNPALWLGLLYSYFTITVIAFTATVSLLFGVRTCTSIDLWYHLLRIDYSRAEKCDYDDLIFSNPDYNGPDFAMEPRKQ